jgi:hypothetical protein
MFRHYRESDEPTNRGRPVNERSFVPKGSRECPLGERCVNGHLVRFRPCLQCVIQSHLELGKWVR